MFTSIVASSASRRAAPGVAIALAIALIACLLSLITPAAAANRPTFASISPNQASLTAGQQQTFTVTVTNTSSETRTVMLTVALPAELRYIAGSASNGGSATALGDITWPTLSLAGSASRQVTFALTPSGAIAAQKTVSMLALVGGSIGTAALPAAVTLTPGTPQPSAFSSSTMAVTPDAITTDEKATYTITLKNSGSTAPANVTVQLDRRLEFVSGSGSPSYDSANKRLTWTGVSVPGGGQIDLTFEARLVWYVNAPSIANTTAAIVAGAATVNLSASVLLVSGPINPPPPIDALAGSFKLVTQHVLGPDEQATYKIVLHNSSTSAVEADVTDPVPAALSYVAGSASPSASFTGGTLTWEDVDVPAGGTVILSFDVRPAEPVANRVSVVNVATIVADGKTYERRANILLLLPEPPPVGEDDQRPEVTSVEIAGGDVLTDPNITLNISARDNGDVTKMQIREWVLDRSARPPRWRPVRTSPLIDFQSPFQWRLSETGGTHFIGVWVQDEAGNLSVLDRGDIDFASLLIPDSTVAAGESRPYLVQLEQGQSVGASLTTSAGDADLYVWYPGLFGLPDQKSAAGGTTPDSVSFTAPRDGTYVFLVFGYEASTYSLSITPGAAPATAAVAGASLDEKGPGLLAEPVLSLAGTDPLSTVVGNDGTPMAPPSEFVYLPLTRR